MLTTAGLISSAISAKLIAARRAEPVDVPRRGAAGSPPPADCAVLGVREPATIKPTRKAAVAVSTSVTRTKRRFMSRL